MPNTAAEGADGLSAQGTASAVLFFILSHYFFQEALGQKDLYLLQEVRENFRVGEAEIRAGIVGRVALARTKQHGAGRAIKGKEQRIFFLWSSVHNDEVRKWS